MREVLLGLTIAGMAAMTTCVVAAFWVRHSLRRRLRISPTARSTAPTVWLVSPTGAARLHLRLRRVGASARAASALDPSLTDLANELIADAVSLEPAVVAVARSGRTRTSPRHGVSAQVSELEVVGRQLTALSIRATGGSTGPVRLQDRVGALAAARQELADIERAAGLHPRSPQATPATGTIARTRSAIAAGLFSTESR